MESDTTPAQKREAFGYGKIVVSFCTILLPSRQRPMRLMAALDSIRSGSPEGDWDVLIRFDDDDALSLGYRQRLSTWNNVVLTTGPRLQWDCYLENMIQGVNSTWIWMMNDDVVVSGDWYARLKEVPTQGYYAQPSIHRLNHSTYKRDPRGPCAFFINGCWKQCGMTAFPQCADYAIPDALERIGWHCHFLDGVEVFHDRDSPDEIARHRQ